MTLTITNNGGVPYAVGPGYMLFVHTDTGPVPVTDYVGVNVMYAAFQNPLVRGTKKSDGSTTFDVVLGVSEIEQLLYNLDVYKAPGASVYLDVVQYHQNPLSVVESATFTGWTWDPTGGIFNLLIKAIQSITAPNSDIAAIKNAVIRTFPAP